MQNNYWSNEPLDVNGKQFVPGYIVTEQEKSNIRIGEAQAKAVIELQKQLALDAEKYRRREERRALKEAEYNEIMIDSTGEIRVVPKNTLINYGPREVCNFKRPQLSYLAGPDGEMGVYELEMVINQNIKKVYFTAAKIGSGKYLLGKIHAAGGIVFCKKPRDMETFVSNLISCLIAEAKEKLIPLNCGWNRTKDDKWHFVEEGELIWSDVKNLSK